MRTIEVSDETYEKIKRQFGIEEIREIDDYSEIIGNKYFFRPVTYHLIGEVKKQMGDFLELKEASWVADSGRFTQAIKEGKLNEVEPVGTAYVNLKSVTDFFPWIHPLPQHQK